MLSDSPRVYLSLPPETLARIDRVARRRFPWLSRSGRQRAIRMLIDNALAAEESPVEATRKARNARRARD